MLAVGTETDSLFESIGDSFIRPAFHTIQHNNFTFFGASNEGKAGVLWAVNEALQPDPIECSALSALSIDHLFARTFDDRVKPAGVGAEPHSVGGLVEPIELANLTLGYSKFPGC
jgi:hypothetical protein